MLARTRGLDALNSSSSCMSQIYEDTSTLSVPARDILCEYALVSRQ